MWPFSKKRDVVDLTPLRNRVKASPDNIDLTPASVSSSPVSDNDSSGLGFLGSFAGSAEPSSIPPVLSSSSSEVSNPDLKMKIDDMEYKVDSISRRINSLIDRIDLVEKKVDRNQRLGN